MIPAAKSNLFSQPTTNSLWRDPNNKNAYQSFSSIANHSNSVWGSTPFSTWDQQLWKSTPNNSNSMWGNTPFSTQPQHLWKSTTNKIIPMMHSVFIPARNNITKSDNNKDPTTTNDNTLKPAIEAAVADDDTPLLLSSSSSTTFHDNMDVSTDTHPLHSTVQNKPNYFDTLLLYGAKWAAAIDDLGNDDEQQPRNIHFVEIDYPDRQPWSLEADTLDHRQNFHRHVQSFHRQMLCGGFVIVSTIAEYNYLNNKCFIPTVFVPESLVDNLREPLLKMNRGSLRAWRLSSQVLQVKRRLYP